MGGFERKYFSKFSSMSFLYPSLLRPTAVEALLVNEQLVAGPKVELRLRKWAGAAIADDFGHKPLLEVAGKPLFAELCIYELFRLSGWDARWIETYGASAQNPACFTQWLPEVARAGQQRQPIADKEVADLLQRLAAANHNSYADCWDTVGWHNSTILFAELKRYKKDKLQPTQLRWLQAGLQVGLQPENFLLVEWDFA